MTVKYSHERTHRLIWAGGTDCHNIAIYNALILSHGHFVFSVGGGGLVSKTTHETGDSAFEVDDSLGSRGLCTWHKSLVPKWKQLLFSLLNQDVILWMSVVSFMIRKKHIRLSSFQDPFAYVHWFWCFCNIYINIFICFISWYHVTLLSFGNDSVYYNFKTNNLRSTGKCCHPFSVNLHFNESEVPHKYIFHVMLAKLCMMFNGGLGKLTVNSDIIWPKNVFH